MDKYIKIEDLIQAIIDMQEEIKKDNITIDKQVYGIGTLELLKRKITLN